MEADGGLLPDKTGERLLVGEHPSYRLDPFWVQVPEPASTGDAPALLPGGSADCIFLGWHDLNSAYQSLSGHKFTIWDPNGFNCFLQGEKFLAQYQTESRRFEALGAQWDGLVRAFLSETKRLVKSDTAGKAELATGDTRTSQEVDFYKGHASVEAMLAQDDEIWLCWNRPKERWETFRTTMDNGGLATVGSSAIAARTGSTDGSGDAELMLLDGTGTGDTVTLYNSAGEVAANSVVQYKWIGNRRYIDVAKCS